jgi:hypothetical protein
MTGIVVESCIGAISTGKKVILPANERAMAGEELQPEQCSHRWSSGHTGDQEGYTLKTSAYTEAKKHPATAIALGVATVAAVMAARQHGNGRMREPEEYRPGR